MRPFFSVLLHSIAFAVVASVWFMTPSICSAHSMSSYSDTISTSQPGAVANHNISFSNTIAIPGGSVITVQFPGDFTVGTSSSLFAARDVELLVNGVARAATTTASAVNDGIAINRGAGGSIVYTLASGSGIAANASLSLLLSNKTPAAHKLSYSYSTSTGTTTTPADVPPITNAATTGNHLIHVSVAGASKPIDGDFYVVMITPVGVDAPNFRTFPPIRSDGAPSSTVSGTTLSVEISLHTDEFSVCKWSSASGTPYASMPHTFSDTGLVVHTDVVAVTQGVQNNFYVRCIDQYGNYNTDDYLISFYVNNKPTGVANNTGNVQGSGTGSGDTGTGNGSGAGGTTGNSSGQASTVGNTSGGGGTGGGSGGGSSNTTGSGTAGGLSGAGLYPSGDANVIINGYAFPGASIHALVDGTEAQTGTADGNGQYSVTIKAISRGAYNFGVYAVDSAGVKSSTFSTSFTVTGGLTSSLSNINLMPTIKVTPDPADLNSTVTFSGYALPNAIVTIETLKDGSTGTRQTYTATAGNDGSWKYDMSTSGLGAGTYKVRAKEVDATQSIETPFSDYTYYGIGQQKSVLTADLNSDGKVNLTDFSILLFWWGKDGGNSNPPADINGDGTVSLTDFSIMLFQWTG